MNATQYRQSPDGGTRHVHGTRDKLPDGWTLHDGPIPGPDMVQLEIDSRIREKAIEKMIKQITPEERAEIEQEVRDAQR